MGKTYVSDVPRSYQTDAIVEADMYLHDANAER